MLQSKWKDNPGVNLITMFEMMVSWYYIVICGNYQVDTQSGKEFNVKHDIIFNFIVGLDFRSIN